MAHEAVHNRNLVLSRIGIGHRLGGLLGIDRARRTWDLALSVYDPELRFEPDDCIDIVHLFKGGKWNGIHAFFCDHPGILDQYDYFWLVDDDIEASVEQVDGLFAYVRDHRFEIAQPALTSDSYYSHRLTLQCPGFSHRQTNFVELMMPVLSKNVLLAALPCFESTRSGLGLDWLWNRFASDAAQSIAIIDAIAMPHRRPLKQHLRQRMAKEGISADDERRDAMAKWRVRPIYPVAFAGLLLKQERVASRWRMSVLMTRAYWSLRHAIVRPRWLLRDYLRFAVRQVLARI